MKLCVAFVLAATALLVAAEGDAKSSAFTYSLPQGEEKWWHNAIVYQIYPRSFKDSNGDGIGDIKGITSKLPYLKDIGVTAVWLSPIYPSPQVDFGYDISDFTNVDPAFGTLADVDQMIKAVHDLGMKVVLDLVPNHSSDKHEWFTKSANGDEEYKNYYIWSDKGVINQTKTDKPAPPNNWVSHFRNSAWEWNDVRKAYYLHQFAVQQPDLNYREPKVVTEMENVYKFWMDRGVDGFRVDAAPFLFEDASLTDEPLSPDSAQYTAQDYEYYTHTNTMDLDETYDQVQKWRTLVDTYKAPNSGDAKVERVMMTESYTTLNNTIKYYGTKDKLGASFTFNFEAITTLKTSSGAADFKATIDSWLSKMEDWRWPNWVMGNHDNKRAGTRFPGLEDALNMISLTLPGTAMTYYGEEIGMADAYIPWSLTKDPQALSHDQNTYLMYSRDPCRTPFQWEDVVSAGFSTNPETWMPANPDFWMKNMEAQKNMERSHLKIYKALAAARKTETMKKGSTETSLIGEDILKIVRSLAGSDTYVTLVNFGSYQKTIQLSDVSTDNKQVFSVYTASMNSVLKEGIVPESFVLRAKAGVVLTTGSALKTTSAPKTPEPTQPPPAPPAPVVTTGTTSPPPPPPSSASKLFSQSAASLLPSLLMPLLLLLLLWR